MEIKHIHFIAICGTGMSSLAGLFIAAGYQVTGSDQNIYPPISDVLKELNIFCCSEYRAENITNDVDLVIIGNAVSKTNLEVAEVLKRNITFMSFPQALANFFLKDKHSLVITGTHGKTTTASLLAWVLESAGEDPGFMIGGISKNLKQNYKYSKGKYFVIEGDEYDTAFFDKEAKFLHYQPQSAVITSIEFDHADIYNSLSEIKNAFLKFIKLIPENGLLLTYENDKNIKEVIEHINPDARIESYGIDGPADWIAKKIQVSEQGISFKVSFDGQFKGDFSSSLFGYHNLKNTLAVIALVFNLGISLEKIQNGIRTFKGVKRRQDIVGIVNDILIMDDFAHHPTAIFETLSALKIHFPQRRLWVIFEPRSATCRRNVFQDGFVSALKIADKIIIADIFLPERIPIESRLDVKKIVHDLFKEGRDAESIPTADEIAGNISGHLKPGDLVCIMSSGGFDRLHEKILKKLNE